MLTMAYTSEVAVAIKRSQKTALTTALSKLSSSPPIPKNANTVVIKPSIYNPDYAGNTTVELLKALVSTFKSIGKVVVAESDNPIRTTENAFSKSGYHVLEKCGAELVNLSSVELVPTTMPGFMIHSLRLPILLSGPRFFVNAATAKTEPGIIAMGGGIKNLLGLIPEKDKSIYHSRIDDILLDLLSVFPPDLTVIDLTEIVIGSRRKGITRKVGGVIVGLDPVAVDAYCATLFDLEPMQINVLRRAKELGLGEALPDKIRVLGTENQKRRLSEICKQI